MTARQLRRTGIGILLAGLLAAGLVAWRASGESDLSHGYEIVGGQVFASEQSDAARQQQLEHIGGKAAVWAVEFNEWMGSLWHGKRLAATVAVLAAVAMLACFHVAGLMDDHPEGDADS
ncbi:hypothetical protein [Pelomonas sp. KK5]|uniref:hypothetical protein n=1 Tax=Pelomonas sp. KK5 TaxID=1855730 RepID=UPI00097CA8D5|nr:hypothetical protein [Pelomonas sp. KK5]